MYLLSYMIHVMHVICTACTIYENSTNRSYHIEEQVGLDQPYGIFSMELAGNTCGWFLRYKEQALMGQSCQVACIAVSSETFSKFKAHYVRANILIRNLGIMRLFVRSCREYFLNYGDKI